MWKQRLKGALILLGIQVIIGIFFGTYLYFNYVNFTKEISKTEDFGTTHILSGNKNLEAKIVNTTDILEYKGKYGYIFSGYINTGSAIWKTKKHTEVIQIDDEAIKNTMYFNYLLKNNYIDIYIYDYYTSQDINDFNIFYNNIYPLSKYFNKKIIPIGIGVINEDFQNFKNMVDKKEYYKVIDFLKNTEDEIKGFYKDEKYKNKIISPIFINDDEFKYLIKTIYDDKNGYFQDNLDKVSKIFGIDKNLILAGIVCEQLRGFYTYRGIAKDLIKTNRYIMNMYDFSLGIGGIKETAAKQIEIDMKKNNKDIYDKYFTYTGNDVDNQRNKKLTDNENYFYQILYVGGLIYNIQQKRSKAGYDISKDPGVILTLYNFGNPQNKTPNPLPKIGGSVIRIDGVDYTFGGLGAVMYYYFKMYM